MLTVDFDRLGLRSGDRLLDMGCGAGRHAFESMRRGARVVALDYSFPELVDVKSTYFAMVEAGEIASDAEAGAIRGDALRLPFPDGTFDRIIASEVLEHIDDDEGAIAELTRVLRPGGTMAVTVPSWLPEQLCWKLSDEYYAPKAVGGHVRIYREKGMQEKLSAAGLDLHGTHRAHALHSPYWWLKCAVGPTNDGNRAVAAYRKFLEWDIIKAPRSTRIADKVLNPLIGKSVVHYSSKPAAVRSGAAPEVSRAA